jgi:hypothetical protein
MSYAKLGDGDGKNEGPSGEGERMKQCLLHDWALEDLEPLPEEELGVSAHG